MAVAIFLKTGKKRIRLCFFLLVDIFDCCPAVDELVKWNIGQKVCWAEEQIVRLLKEVYVDFVTSRYHIYLRVLPLFCIARSLLVAKKQLHRQDSSKSLSFISFWSSQHEVSFHGNAHRRRTQWEGVRFPANRRRTSSAWKKNCFDGEWFATFSRASWQQSMSAEYTRRCNDLKNALHKKVTVFATYIHV